jgi:flagellar biogenesis protein FliO
MDLLKALGAFILVIIILLIFLKILSHLTRGRGMTKGGKAFTLRGTMIIDSRRYLAAVEIDGHLLVVGVSHDRLTALAHWPLAVESDPLARLFKDGDTVEGPKAVVSAPSARPSATVDSRVPPKARATEPDAPINLLDMVNKSVKSAQARPTESTSGPGLGPGIKTGLGADPRTAANGGPELDLSLDDDKFEGLDTNDDFLKMFSDDHDRK